MKVLAVLFLFLFSCGPVPIVIERGYYEPSPKPQEQSAAVSDEDTYLKVEVLYAKLRFPTRGRKEVQPDTFILPVGQRVCRSFVERRGSSITYGTKRCFYFDGRYLTGDYGLKVHITSSFACGKNLTVRAKYDEYRMRITLFLPERFRHYAEGVCR